jgi:hypothetical protein
MKKFCVKVVTESGKTISTQMSVDFEPTDTREGKATLWCEKCAELQGTVKITKLTTKYRWQWTGVVIGGQNHHTSVNISAPKRTPVI